MDLFLKVDSISFIYLQSKLSNGQIATYLKMQIQASLLVNHVLGNKIQATCVSLAQKLQTVF